MQTAPAPSIITRYPRRRLAFALNTALFALSSGIGGLFIGVMIGYANYFSGPSYSMGPGGFLTANSLDQVVRFCAIANGSAMSIFGLFIGVLLFAFIGTTGSRRWSARQKARFAQGLKTRFFLPLLPTPIISGFLVGLCWLLLQGGPSAKVWGELGNIMVLSSMVALLLGASFYAWRLALFAKRPIQSKPIVVERLLPLD